MKPVRGLPLPVLGLFLLLPPGGAGEVGALSSGIPTSGAFPAGLLPAADTTGPVLSGRIVASGFREGEGLPGALLEIRQAGRHQTVLTDVDGRYRIAGLTPGPARIRVFHIAARPADLEVTLPAQGVLRLEVELERRILTLAPLTVEIPGVLAGPPTPTAPLGEARTRSARVAQVAMGSTTGMVESGLVQGPFREPHDPGDAGSVLYMRGSTVDSRQVLLDGAPILTPFHLAGLLPSFDLGVLGDARYHAGGATARLDGGLSYILELETREPTGADPHLEVALDPVAGRVGVELPLAAGVGFLGVVRGLHGLAGSGFGEGAELPYLYRDATLRLAMRPRPGLGFHLTAFRNREGVWLGALGRSPHAPSQAEFDEMGDVVRGAGSGWYHDRALWGNEALSARGAWEGPVKGGSDRSLRMEGGVSVSRYEATLPIPWIDPLQARTGTEVIRGELLLTHRRSPSGRFRWGGSVERRDFAWDLLPLTPAPATSVAMDGAEARSTRAGVFGEVARDLAPGLHLQAGVRAEHFSADASLRIAPRIAVRQSLGDAATLTLSAGRYHEVLPLSSLRSEGTTLEEASVFWAPVLGVGTSTHGILTLDQLLSDDLRMEVSGFVKHFDGTVHDPQSQAARAVHASGTELRVLREGPRFDGWIGYALTWVWSAGFDDFAGRHLLSTGGTFRLPGGGEAGVVVGYGAGLPLTGVGVAAAEPDAPGRTSGDVQVPRFGAGTEVRSLATASPSNSLPVTMEDAFFRVDLDVAWSFEPVVGGRTTILRPYLRVLNALDQRDAHFHYFDRWRDQEVRPLASRPFLPLAGVSWRF